MSVEKIAQKIEDADLRMFNIKQNEKLDPALNRSHLKEITFLNHFYAQKSQCPRRL